MHFKKFQFSVVGTTGIVDGIALVNEAAACEEEREDPNIVDGRVHSVPTRKFESFQL